MVKFNLNSEPYRSTLERMKAARRWLIYQIIQQQDGKKPRKVPHYVNGQRRQITDTREDLEQLVSFTEAKAALGDRSGDWGLGFELRDGKDPHWTGSALSPTAATHFGASGTLAVIDPQRDLVAVVLANRGTYSRWMLEPGGWGDICAALVA